MAATTAAINKFTTITKPDCAENHITTSTHKLASITTTTESENRVGTSVEVLSTPPRSKMMLQSHWEEKMTLHQSDPKVHTKSTYKNCLH